MKNRNEVMAELGVICEELELPFPLYEYQNRLKKIRKSMAENNIDMMYFTMPESMYYISGLNLVWYQVNSSSMWNDSKNAGIAVHVDYDKFLLFTIPDEEGSVMGSTCCSEPIVINDTPGTPIMFGKEYEAPRPGETFNDLVIKHLDAKRWLGGRVGIEMQSPRPNRIVSEMFQVRLEGKGCEVIDATELLLNIRGVKSPLEMNYIRMAAKLADIGHEAIATEVKEGMTELELVAEYTFAMYKAGSEVMAISDSCRFGKAKKWCVHAPAGRRRLLRGDLINVDLSGVKYRYHANVARTYAFESVDGDTMDMFEKAEMVTLKAMEILKPDMYVNDFLKEMIDYFKQNNIWGDQYWFGGYELGASFPPDWCGNFVYDPFIDAGEKRFVPGTVINFESGFMTVDTVIFTEEKAELLGNTPWKQIVESRKDS